MFRRDVFDDLGGFDETLPACEDYDLWLRWTARHSVHFVAEELVIKHGGHEDQLSRRFPVMDRFRIRALSKLLRSEEVGQLDAQELAAAAETLQKKVEIVAQGARRRGRASEAEELQRELEDVLTGVANGSGIGPPADPAGEGAAGAEDA